MGSGGAGESAVTGRPARGDFSGKKILVTGARQGIGFACAQAFAEAGAQVALADISPEVVGAAERIRNLTGAETTEHQVDLADPATAPRLVREVVEKCGGIDVLVYAAGVLVPEPFLELSVDAWDRTFAVNARAAILVAQATARHLVDRGAEGRIILFASIVARSVARLNNTSYAASKAALVQAARCMALELAPRGITVNAISPGSTSTDMLLDVQMGGDPAAVESVIRGDAASWRLGIPLGRLADPSDQAAMALSLIHI